MSWSTACGGVLLHFPDGLVCSVFLDKHDPGDVLEELPSITSTTGTSQRCVGAANFHFKLPRCKDCVFVAFLPESTVSCLQGMMNVYAVGPEEEGRLTKKEVQNRFCETYGLELLKGKVVTVEHYGEAVDSNEHEDVCPSGTILLATSDSMSRSSSAEFSPGQIVPSFPSPPEMEQSPNQNLCVPTLSPRQSISSSMIVSRNSNSNFQPVESGITSSGGSYREGPTLVTELPQKLSLLHEVEKAQRKDYGDTGIQSIAIETPANEEQHPFVIEVTPPPEKQLYESNETDTPEPPLNGQTVAQQDVTHDGKLEAEMPKVNSFQEDNKTASKELVTSSLCSMDSQEGVDHHHGNSDMVIGVSLNGVGMAKDSEQVHGKFSLCTSSDPRKLDQLAVPTCTRASSLTSLSALRNDSVTDAVDDDKDVLSRPPLGKAKSLPTSSLNNLVAGMKSGQVVPSIQRQMSGANETVIEGEILALNNTTMSAHVEESEHESTKVDFRLGGDASDVDDLSDNSAPLQQHHQEQSATANLSHHHHSTERLPVNTPSDYPDLSAQVELQVDSYHTQESPTVNPPSEELSSMDWLKQQVHILEHACNDTCPDGEQCVLSPKLLESIEQMKNMVQDINCGEEPPSDDFKKTIVSHCNQCPGVGCKVPHRAAGCLPPGECVPCSSSSDESDSPYTRTETTPTPPTSFGSIGQVSVDVDAAYMSTTSMVQQFHETHGPMACTDEENHHPKPIDLKLNSRHPRINAIHSPALRDLYQTKVATPTEDQYPLVPHPHTSTLGQTTAVDMTTMEAMNTRAHQHARDYYNAPRRADRQSTMHVFIQHNPEANARMRSRIEPASPALPEIGKGGFPPLDVYKAWISSTSSETMAIFSNQNEVEATRLFTAGLKYPRPSTTRLNDEIDKGGNGKVYNYLLQNCTLAVKLTFYRPNELNVWYKLNHRNIVPLYGVMLHDDRQCFQIMPRMTTTLRKVLRNCGDLQSLLKQETSEIWEGLIYPNAVFIFREILSGLEYLHSNNIQHCDMKASNILILKTCHCPDILHCSCPNDKKYEVRIADFDSVKESKYPIDASKLPTVEHVAKTKEDMDKVMGTKTYRAPEQFQRPKYDDHAYKKMYEGFPDFVCNLEGPYCDLWSVGCIMVQFCIGALTPEDKSDVSCLHHLPQYTDITPTTEGTLAITRFKRLAKACLEHSKLVNFGKLAERCLELDFKRRPTVKELLNNCDLFKRL